MVIFRVLPPIMEFIKEVVRLVTPNRNRHQDLTEEIRGKVESLPITEREEWLRTVYQVRTDRFLAENSKIWITGSIFVPVALSPIAVWATIDKQTLIKLWVLFGVSFTMQLFWIVVAHVHKRYQNIHFIWLLEIERAQGMKVPHPDKLISINICRLLLTLLILVMWFIIFSNTAKDLPL